MKVVINIISPNAKKEMEKFTILSMFLMIISKLSLSQELNSMETASGEDYLLRSEKQKNVFRAIGIPGAVLVSFGMILYMSEYGDGLPGGTDYHKKSNSGEFIMLAGGGLVLAAIPFAIASRNNKNKAMSVNLKNQGIRQLKGGTVVSQCQPSLSLTIKWWNEFWQLNWRHA